MSQQFCLDLKQIPDEQTAKMAAEVLLQSLVVDNVLKKQIGKDFFNKCLRNLQDQKGSPELKVNTLSIFRFIDLKNRTALKVFSILTGHPIYAYFMQQARSVDPRKSISQKGKTLFPKNKQLGVKYIRLILESLKFWNQRFPATKQKQPTKYRKVFLRLVQEKVTFPDSYIYYNTNESPEQKQQKTTPGVDPNKYARENQREIQKKVQINSPGMTENAVNGQQQKVTKSSIMLLFNKIQSYTDFLEDAQSIEQLQRQVTKNHKMFEKQQKRLASSNVFSIQDDKIVSLYLKMNQFFLDEKQIYEEWIVQKDSLKMYIDTLLINFDNTFSDELDQDNKMEEKKPKSKVQATSNANKQTIKNEQMKSKEKFTSQNANSSTISNKENTRQEKRKYESVNSQKERQRPSKKPRQDSEQDDPRPKLNQKRSIAENDEIKDKGLRGFFDSHLERPANKSLSGFKAIKQSLEKEKKKLKANPVRGKSPISTSMSKTKFNASTVSNIQPNSIFAKPPNSNIRSKKYDGTFVFSNPQLEGVLHDIEKEQGMKRFKISNLKNRALLYQSEHIQVGYKSEPIYERAEGIDKGSQMIQLELFIGNKTKDDIRSFQVIFQGDQKSLVYSNPQKAPETIYSGDQCIFTVIIIPCAQSYTMTMMHLSYKFNSYQMQASCVLPSTILNFSSYNKADVRDMNDYERTQAIKCYQTEKFALSHYFPPRKLVHYIEELAEITSYSEFVQNGSEKDFVLGAFVTIKNKYSGLLKINVRPDLSMVIQLLSNNESDQAQNQFKLYLQTLFMVLKQHR